MLSNERRLYEKMKLINKLFKKLNVVEYDKLNEV